VIENTVDGKSYVTARGWEDLSETIYLYEESGYTVDETLVGQYLRNKRIAREFSAYYDLYQKYKKDYRVHQILSGNADAEVKKRAKNAGFDERISLLGLLLDALQNDIRKNVEQEESMKRLLVVLKAVKETFSGLSDVYTATQLAAILDEKADEAKQQMDQEDRANVLSGESRRAYQLIIYIMQKDAQGIRMANITKPDEAFAYIKEQFDGEVQAMRRESEAISQQLSNLFAFVEKTFGDGNEMLILVTDLTVNYNSAKFISQKGCKEYFKYNKKYQLYERQQEIADALEQLHL
jgi:hypothetical protein